MKRHAGVLGACIGLAVLVGWGERPDLARSGKVRPPRLIRKTMTAPRLPFHKGALHRALIVRGVDRS